jgi:parallel beta helix pectate lyase-like protein
VRAIASLSLALALPMLAASETSIGPGQDTIQPAIAAAGPGDQIVLRRGLYLLTRSIDFLGKDLTLRSEDGPLSTVLRMAVTPTAASVVIFQGGESERAVLQGFTITGGAGTMLEERNGGGICCINGSSPTLRDLVVVENSATNGGALFCRNSSPTVTGCILSRNRVRCGGGAYCVGSSPAITDCTIEGNVGTYVSSGIHSKGGSAPRITGCKFLGNSTYYGGGIDSFGGSPLVVNCIFAGNSAAHGGAGYVSNLSTLSLINCTIWNNNSLQGGGGIEWVDTPPQLTNCIILGNYPDPAAYSGSGCLFQGDPSFLSPGVYDFGRFKTLPIDGAPQVPDFIVEYPDLHLRAGSLAIDGGASQAAPLTDLDGRARDCGPAVDIGAYEYCGSLPGAYRRGDTNVDGAQDLSDALTILLHLFIAEPAVLSCRASADLNADQAVDVSDAVALLAYLFQDGQAPPEPFQACGLDSSASAGSLNCEEFPACQ